MATQAQIVDTQIADEIEGRIRVKVSFTDAGDDFLSIYEQNGKAWIHPAFCQPRQIDADRLRELKSMFSGKKEYNTDREFIQAGAYDEFYDRFYNSL